MQSEQSVWGQDVRAEFCMCMSHSVMLKPQVKNRIKSCSCQNRRICVLCCNWSMAVLLPSVATACKGMLRATNASSFFFSPVFKGKLSIISDIKTWKTKHSLNFLWLLLVWLNQNNNNENGRSENSGEVCWSAGKVRGWWWHQPKWCSSDCWRLLLRTWLGNNVSSCCFQKSFFCFCGYTVHLMAFYCLSGISTEDAFNKKIPPIEPEHFIVDITSVANPNCPYYRMVSSQKSCMAMVTRGELLWQEGECNLEK